MILSYINLLFRKSVLHIEIESKDNLSIEIKSRHANVIFISDKLNDGSYDNYIQIDNNDSFKHLLCI